MKTLNLVQVFVLKIKHMNLGLSSLANKSHVYTSEVGTSPRAF